MQINELQQWLQQQIPAALQAAPPQVRLYPDELVIVLDIAAPADADASARQALIAQQRENTRGLRMQIADEVQRRSGLPVAWGMRAGDLEVLFTTRTMPVMTRLGRAEREVLDTLVAAGVADTRSSALAYTVRAFAAEHGEWLSEVREAIAEVERVRSRLKVRPRRGAPPVASEPEAGE